MIALLPEIALAATALALFLWDAYRPAEKRLALTLAGLGLAASAVLLFRAASTGPAWGGMSFDATARFLKVLTLLGVSLVVVFSSVFTGFRDERFPWGTYLGLLLLSLVGMFLLVGANDFILVLIALELISVTSFVLTGIARQDKRSSEAALKYFLVGAFSAGLMIYGFSLLYGVTGTTRVDALLAPDAAWPRLPLVGALLFVLAGVGFKLALAPFHMWAPDVYEGAPTPVTAFLSVAPKAAAFGFLLRALPNHAALQITPLLAALSALTMTFGNLAALRQTNLKRLLAYSSVAQMGYVLMGVVAGGSAGAQGVLVYLAGYLFMNLGAFATVLAVTEDAGRESVDAYDGLARRSLPLALLTVVFMLSLTGLPPFVGFIGKFSLFSAVVQSRGLVWLAVIAAANSAVSFAYYVGLLRAAFFGEARRSEAVRLSPALSGCLAVTAAATLAAGLFPNALFELVRKVLP